LMESFSEKEPQIDFYRVDIAQHQDIAKQIGALGVCFILPSRHGILR
jgi:hypothetical protein